MPVEVLTPRLDLLSEEYVLVQAWKKTAAYIRQHNWFSDTLELDRTTINLPRFLSELADLLKAPTEWRNDPIRIVPAPKSQAWHVSGGRQGPVWGPIDKGKAKLRPLAHASLKDQVAATAVMLCLADRVETAQGDPRGSVTSAKVRRSVVSYGNRLLCDGGVSGALRHRWGTAKLYRSYYQDYRNFLARPEAAAEAHAPSGNLASSHVVVVHSDLRQFYDRVRPELLTSKLKGLIRADDDPRFFELAARVLDWEWHKTDAREVAAYAQQAHLSDFSRIALPQGLVAAGFFANVVLLEFDRALQASLASDIATGVHLVDACRNVDDLRIVVSLDSSRAKDLDAVEVAVAQWIQDLLEQNAPSMEVSKEKTKAATFRGDDYPLVRQSVKMQRVQRAVSGGFDAIGGEEILAALQGLLRSQERFTKDRVRDHGWSFGPVPDVRDATVARFAAARFRKTYRSLRPLLADLDNGTSVGEDAGRRATSATVPGRRTQAELDDDARAFALGLIENWVNDPSNVRLLRVGLDIWPAVDVLEPVLSLLRPFTERNGRRKERRRVAWYCLAEIFRAGATETGFVGTGESLPPEIDIDAYRSVLRREAMRLASLSSQTLPWYLRQQILLFLATGDTTESPIARQGHSPETQYYRQLLLFLGGKSRKTTSAGFATLAVLARRSFRGPTKVLRRPAGDITSHQLEEIAERDSGFALELLEATPNMSAALPARVRHDLCLVEDVHEDGWASLGDVVLRGGPLGPLRNELALLDFASKFLGVLGSAPDSRAISPEDVLVRMPAPTGVGVGTLDVSLLPQRGVSAGSMYEPPGWCPGDERWRFQLGYLLRFVLSAQPDFTRGGRKPRNQDRGPIYRPAGGHWLQRRYGLFSGHAGFGDDWLPISDWVEMLLLSLLRWPGCRDAVLAGVDRDVTAAKAAIDDRVRDLRHDRGDSSGVLMLRLRLSRADASSKARPLRACVLQTVVPSQDDYKTYGPTLEDAGFRVRHKNHLATALAAIERLLDLRDTHKNLGGGLDWLILPELAVHSDDVNTHLVPFARKHRTIILAGLVYERLIPGQPLVNSALWIVPRWSATQGLQVTKRRQGKFHLAQAEQALNASGTIVQGWRPVQWLMGYEWCTPGQNRPLWLTSSVCYDATDLQLASDLRTRSDVFAIPALNRDVSTFDQMALALHCHMFQIVIVANNGSYGGSNAYAPYKEPWFRQVFHLHGQPQASAAFLEIEDIGGFIDRLDVARAHPSAVAGASPPTWKYPHAGL